MMSPNSISCCGLNKSFAGSAAGASRGGQADWARTEKAQKKSTAKRRARPIRGYLITLPWRITLDSSPRKLFAEPFHVGAGNFPQLLGQHRKHRCLPSGRALGR